jgi:hypothetical protein
MKDYNVLFNAFNKKLIRRAKTMNVFAFIFVATILPGLITIAILLFYSGYGIADFKDISMMKKPALMFFVLSMMLILFLFLSDKPRIRIFYTKKLRDEAQDYARTSYYNDLLKALGTEFPDISQEFKNKLLNLIEEHSWFRYHGFTFEPEGLTLDYATYDDEFLEIKHKGWRYFLTAWEYSPDLPFLFTFDKENTNGGELGREILHLPKTT